MHFGMIAIAIGLGWLVRFLWLRFSDPQCPSWTPTLAAFLCPPFLLWMTAIAILCMGHHGRMMGNSVGWVSCVIASGWCLYGLGLLLYAGWQTWRSHQSLSHCPPVTLLPAPSSAQAIRARFLDISIPFAAQVGFWRSHLVVSAGILSHLPHNQVQAIVCHEQGHAHYRDCFWFFWLGWLRRMMLWLPATDALWQDLIVLRELRADQWAAQRVDRL
ncbi:MAG: M56 family metallopeptidase, partial [Elainellaceae cyanobacterium]